MAKFSNDDITWYEDGNMVEYYPDGTLENRVCVVCDLKETIKFAQENKLCLIIQPAFQDETIFVDYTE